MDYYSQFLKEKREGKYAGCRYPNLIEIHGGMPTDYFAGVTPELMLAVFRGEEELKFEEIFKIARYNGIPLSVLTCPKLIMLDMGRRKHRKMVGGACSLYAQLRRMVGEGNQEAERYMEFADWKYQQLIGAARGNRLSYGHYLSARKALSDYVGWSVQKPKLRGLARQKGGAE